MTFHIGQRVVCVDAEHTNPMGIAELDRGRIYTIRELAGCHCIRLVEVRRRVPHHRAEPPFFAHRFRLLDERRIDQFRAHLAPVDRHLVPA